MHNLLSTQDVAELLGKDRSTVSRMVARGELEPTAKGPGRTGAHLFTAAAVERFKRGKQRPDEGPAR